MASIGQNVNIHVNPRVYTEYNAMMNAWHITLMCCGEKSMGAVTQEFLMNSLGNPGDLTWELFKVFRAFIVRHPYTRTLLLQLTHGSLEQGIDSFEDIGSVSKYATSWTVAWKPNVKFFPMEEFEKKFWRDAMNSLGIPESEHHRFFDAPKIANSNIADPYDYVFENDKLHPGGLVHSPGLVIEHSNSLGRDERVDKLPGIKEIVKHPVYKTTKKEVGHGITGYWRLESTIIDLNDQHNWTREQIADWLDSLDIDIRFRGEDSDERS
jgi:hypothetical protein